LPWPNVGTIEDSCLQYTDYVASLKRKSPEKVLYVVFDSYEIIITKDQEQKRRGSHATQAPDVVITPETPIPLNKPSFVIRETNRIM